MPDYTPTKHLVLSNGVIAGGQVTFSGISNIFSSGDVIDNDNSGTATSGDYFTSISNVYSGYTVEIGGSIYALFVNSSFNTVFIPNDGELSTTSLTSPYPVTENANATVVNCFAAGTLITTPHGEVAVETLGVGDLLHTADGRSIPVKWVGRDSVNTILGDPRQQPVRIRAGALGDGLPHSDLTVTADHGMILDGLVINASALVNSSTIDWLPLSEMPRNITYYHIETDAHDVILANGAASETFVDMPGRRGFDNFDEYIALYGAERIIPEMRRPRIASQRLLPDEIKARLGLYIAAEPQPANIYF